MYEDMNYRKFLRSALAIVAEAAAEHGHKDLLVQAFVKQTHDEADPVVDLLLAVAECPTCGTLLVIEIGTAEWDGEHKDELGTWIKENIVKGEKTSGMGNYLN